MTSTNTPARSPMVKLCGLYENTSKTTGDTYYVGYLGGAKVLLVQERPANPATGER